MICVWFFTAGCRGQAQAPEESGAPTPDTVTSVDSHLTGHTGDTAPNKEDSGATPALTWVYVDTGTNSMSCGLISDGSVECWGLPICTSHAPAPSDRFTQLSVGGFDACGVREDGTVGCWCCDLGGVASEVCTEAPAGIFDRVIVGASIACARAMTGELTCWGWDGFTGEGAQPVGPVGAFAIEANIAAAVLPDGHIQWWGAGSNWEETPPPGIQFADLSIGRNHACGLDVGGTAHCWGVDFDYEPFPDPPLGTFVQIETFHQATCVIDALGAATCWWGADDRDPGPVAGADAGGALREPRAGRVERVRR
jgi:hypothetical protein